MVESIPEVSVVVLTRNEGAMLQSTVNSLAATLPEPAEIIVVDDGGTDGSTDFLQGCSGQTRLFRTAGLGVARGRNFGASKARGRFVIFSDAHIDLPAGWWEVFAELLESPAIGAVGPGITDYLERERRGFGMRFVDTALNPEWLCPEFDDPMPVPLLPGGFWAIRRELFLRAGGLDEGMVQWGSEDFEFSLRLWMMGFELYVAPEVEVAHLFRHESPYLLDSRWPRHNQLRTAYLHFSEQRFRRVKDSLRMLDDFNEGLALFERSSAPERRAKILAHRVRDDDSYFKRFGEI